MILNWSEEFNQNSILWVCMAIIVLLITFIPGFIITVKHLTISVQAPHPAGRWIYFISAATLAWFTIIYSLAFGPAL